MQIFVNDMATEDLDSSSKMLVGNDCNIRVGIYTGLAVNSYEIVCYWPILTYK